MQCTHCVCAHAVYVQGVQSVQALTLKKKPFMKESSIIWRVTSFALGATTNSSSCMLPRQRWSNFFER